MIARSWRGVTAADTADDYLAYLRETGLKDYAGTPGNRGVLVMRRKVGDRCEIVLLSFWDSMESVRAFAGAKPDVAKYYPEDTRFLLEMEPFVRHYEVDDVPAALAAQAPSRL